MKKVFQRLLMFAIAFPTVLAIVLFLPHFNHLTANIIVVLMSSLGAIEFAIIIGKKGYRIPNWEAAILGGLVPLAASLTLSFNAPKDLIVISFMLGSTWIISSRVFSSNDKIQCMASRAASGFSVLVYPGAFMAWIIRINSLPHASQILLIFLLIVFANDSLAWLFGMLFGKGNRGLIPASPNKSLVGFIGGLLASVIVGCLAPLFFPEIFSISKASFLANAFFAGALLGFASGFAAIIGDLAESTIKRSSEVKDSGSIIPGRGGVLDSIDSLSLAAPVFYVAYRLLF
ncbi:phosphatidate cytidylyltransferase [Treponema sp.]